MFFVKNNLVARRCREELLKLGLSTKILPEAYTWHFAGAWQHMPELSSAHGDNLSEAFPNSQAILSSAVSLPVSIKQTADVPSKVRSAIEKAITT